MGNDRNGKTLWTINGWQMVDGSLWEDAITVLQSVRFYASQSLSFKAIGMKPS